MRPINVFIVIASLLGVAHSYEVNCTKYYEVQENENCNKIAADNELSLTLLNTLNPDISCSGDIQIASRICVQGEVQFSMDGTCGEGKGSCPFNECCSKEGQCGTTEEYCGSGCHPDYGMCLEVQKDQDSSSVQSSSIADTVKVTNIEEYDNEKIKDMARVLSIDTQQAKQLYESAEEGVSYFEDAFITAVDHQFTVEQCKDLCYDANQKLNSLIQDIHNPFNLPIYNKYMENTGGETIKYDDLLNLCLSQCYVIKEVNEFMENDKNVEATTTFIDKRAIQSCEPPSSVTISLVSSNYLNGCPKYSLKSGSSDTIIAYINGCSIPIIKDQYNTDDRGLFLPACNSHDLCYGCQHGGKANCDSLFLENMRKICKVAKDNSLGCRFTAQVFYTAVKNFAKKYYDACSDNNVDPNCAFCGASPIQTKLFNTPFYL